MEGENGNRLGIPEEFLRQKQQFFSVPYPSLWSPKWLPTGARASAGHLNPSAPGSLTLSVCCAAVAVPASLPFLSGS